jgi:acetylornithine deacetylase
MGANRVNDLEQLVSDLVAIESINPDLDPNGSGEASIAAYVADWMTTAGLKVTIQETGPGRPNVIGIKRGTSGGKSLMLNAHMDTVGLGKMTDPLVPRIEGNRLYGRGGYDMKASLAAIMLAGRDLISTDLAGDLIITAVTDEEYASIGTQAIVRDFSADACIITEPTDLEICIAHKGFVWADIVTTGVAAHGSLPDVGIDAIAAMGPVLTDLAALDHRLRSGSQHPLLKTGSVHASLIDGGTELSTYPDRCRVQIERRTVPGETRESVTAEMTDLAERHGAFATIGIDRQPFEVAPDHPFVAAFQRVVATELGAPAQTTGAFGWMDSALTSGAGIPTLIFGPVGEGAHADVEWVDLPSVQQCREIYGAMARAWCV